MLTEIGKLKQKKVLLFLIFLLVLLGIIDSIYLLVSHIRNYTDLSYQSFCAISKSLNCDTVAQSSWSIFLGLPLSIWGIFAYSLLFFLIVSPLFKSSDDLGRGWAIFIVIVFCFCLFSTFFAFVSAYEIKSYCLMCVLSYATNLFLFFLSLMARSRFSSLNFFVSIKKDFEFVYSCFFIRRVASLLLVIIVLLILFIPKYWMLSEQQKYNIKSGYLKKTGDPWIGAENPVLTIYEYSDYMCFQCLKMHFYLRKLVAANSNKIRLVHVNYPMDHDYNPIVVQQDFHQGAGKLALISEYASDRSDFWQINDLLFEIARDRGPISIRKISEKTGLKFEEVMFAANSEYYKKILSLDIKRGMLNRVLATPSYVINDRIYTGIIPSEVFEEAGLKW